MVMSKNVNFYISIIIVNFNGVKFIKNCVLSVLNNTAISFEVIIVDNASVDKSLEMIKQNFSTEKKLKCIFLKTNKGPAFARNLAVKKSKGKYLVFLDYDTIVSKNWLKETAELLERDRKIAGGQLKILRMGQKKVYDSAGEKFTSLGFLSERARESMDSKQFDKVENIFSGKGAGMIVRRRIFNKIGGFDEDYFMYWEEPDLSWRIWQSGYRFVFLPTDKIWHAYVTKEKNDRYYQDSQVIYRGCRNAITTLIKNLEKKNLIIILPLHIISWLILSCMFLIQLKVAKSFFIIKGVLWNFINLPLILKKRRLVQKNRIISDDHLFELVGERKNILYYLGKSLAYISGKPF